MSKFLELEQYATYSFSANSQPFNKIQVSGWYANNRVYSGYSPNNIPPSLDKVLYAFAQVGNCAQDFNTVESDWLNYKNNNNNIPCASGSYATGVMSLDIFSTDPYADLYHWANNAERWNYLQDSNQWKGLATLKASANSFPTTISMGGWSGSIQLMQLINQGNVDSIKDFFTLFLPSALNTDQPAWGQYIQNTKASIVNNLNSIDIDLEPYSNDWTQMSPQEINNFVGFMSKLSSLKNIKLDNNQNILSEVTLTISGNPNAPTTIAGLSPNSKQKCQLSYLDQNGVSQLNNLGALVNSVDKIYLMSYDYHGSFDSEPKYTNCHSALFFDDSQPSGITGRVGFNIESAVKAWTDCGVPSSKLHIGIPLYGRAFGKDGTAFTDQPYQPFSGSVPGDWKFSDINNLIQSGNLVGYLNQNAQCAYAVGVDNNNNNVYVSYDTQESVAIKACYAYCNNLGGVMFWELGQDPTNELVNTALNIRDNPGQCSCSSINSMGNSTHNDCPLPI